MEPQDKKSNGAMIGSVIIILILVLGGVYFWMSKQKAKMPIQEEKTADQMVQPANENTSALDEVSSLEAELGQESNTELDIDITNIQ